MSLGGALIDPEELSEPRLWLHDLVCIVEMFMAKGLRKNIVAL